MQNCVFILWLLFQKLVALYVEMQGEECLSRMLNEDLPDLSLIIKEDLNKM